MYFQCVQVKLAIGHRASLKKRRDEDGYTHDWTVFVRGPDRSNIQHFVERVVFHLHESFPKHKRGEYYFVIMTYFYCKRGYISKRV